MKPARQVVEADLLLQRGDEAVADGAGRGTRLGGDHQRGVCADLGDGAAEYLGGARDKLGADVDAAVLVRGGLIRGIGQE